MKMSINQFYDPVSDINIDVEISSDRNIKVNHIKARNIKAPNAIFGNLDVATINGNPPIGGGNLPVDGEVNDILTRDNLNTPIWSNQLVITDNGSIRIEAGARLIVNAGLDDEVFEFDCAGKARFDGDLLELGAGLVDFKSAISIIRNEMRFRVVDNGNAPKLTMETGSIFQAVQGSSVNINKASIDLIEAPTTINKSGINLTNATTVSMTNEPNSFVWVPRIKFHTSNPNGSTDGRLNLSYYKMLEITYDIVFYIGLNVVIVKQVEFYYTRVGRCVTLTTAQMDFTYKNTSLLNECQIILEPAVALESYFHANPVFTGLVVMYNTNSPTPGNRDIVSYRVNGNGTINIWGGLALSTATPIGDPGTDSTFEIGASKGFSISYTVNSDI